MTDKQTDALRLADTLERPGYGWHSTPAQCAAELRRLHAEIETLRTGYEAARLEVESLKAQLAERASHGQAPAQAAPAAVAGPLNELEELNLLNKLVELGAKAAHAHAQSNSDDGHKGTAAYVQWQEMRAEMGELIRSAYAAPTTQPAPIESVLIDGIAYPTPAPVAAELLRLHIDARQPAPQPEPEAYREKWDAELGRTAMRFVDRAGDVHPGIDDAETICAEFYKAMSDVIEKMPHVQRMQPSMSAPASQEVKSHDN